MKLRNFLSAILCLGFLGLAGSCQQLQGCDCDCDGPVHSPSSAQSGDQDTTTPAPAPAPVATTATPAPTPTQPAASTPPAATQHAVAQPTPPPTSVVSVPPTPPTPFPTEEMWRIINLCYDTQKEIIEFKVLEVCVRKHYRNSDREFVLLIDFLHAKNIAIFPTNKNSKESFLLAALIFKSFPLDGPGSVEVWESWENWKRFSFNNRLIRSVTQFFTANSVPPAGFPGDFSQFKREHWEEYLFSSPNRVEMLRTWIRKPVRFKDNELFQPIRWKGKKRKSRSRPTPTPSPTPIRPQDMQPDCPACNNYDLDS